MKNDISPYTCIVENCPTPYRFYVTRNQWREHVLCDHPPKWRCSCCMGTRPVFQSLPSFMAHLDEKHESQVCDENFDRIMAKSSFRTFGITNCPLCNDHGPTDSPELIEHVLGHIYDLSMYALPWRTIPQTALKRPIRTFNDVAPVLDPNDDEDTAEMRMFSHTRILEWVEEPHPDEEKLTPEQKATIRDLHWDDYQAMDNEDRADTIVADYFDRAGIDYFEDDASSRRASSQAGHSASTRQLSIASSRGYSSGAEANPPLSVRKLYKRHRWITTMEEFAEFLQAAERNANPPVELKYPVTVAIIDDGIAIFEQTIRRVMGGRSFCRDESYSEPHNMSSSGHGTAMASLIWKVCPGVVLYVLRLDEYYAGSGKLQFTAESAAKVRNRVPNHVRVHHADRSLSPLRAARPSAPL